MESRKKCYSRIHSEHICFFLLYLLKKINSIFFLVDGKLFYNFVLVSAV